ncbi:MAG: hypothetical protein C4289_12845 [Chloroflexota bacterium]
MLRVLRRRNLALRWLGGLVSMAADWVLSIALPFYVYFMSMKSVAPLWLPGRCSWQRLLPRVLLGTVAGVCVHR